MIRFENVSVAFGQQSVLEHCSLTLPAGSHTALMGPSGCGKTTVLRLILGLQKPQSGRVTVEGRVSCVFQEPRLLPRRTALENINAVLSDKAGTLPEARKWLEAVELSDAANKYPAELSGGMRQRIAIARALAFGGEILLLDEPLKGCDPALRASLTGLLTDWAKDRTLLIVTHDSAEARAFAANLLFMESHRLLDRDF